MKDLLIDIDSITNALSNRDILKTFVIDAKTGKDFSYKDIYTMAYQFSCYLTANSIKRMVLRMDNSINLFISYFAGIYANTIVIPVDVKKSEFEIEWIAKENCAEIFTESRLVEILRQQQECFFDGRSFFEKADFDKPYLITYTSGSTGEPKGVIHSLRSLFLSAVAFGNALHYQEDDVFMHTMPMTYMAGILNSIFLPFIMGCKIVLYERFSMTSAFGFWSAAEKYLVNIFWLAPTMLRILSKLDPEGKMRDIFARRNITISVGTERLDLDLRNEIKNKYDVKIYQSYGLSETLFISTEIKEDNNIGNSSGRILQGCDLSFGNDGEIIVSVPWLFLGYVGMNKYNEKFYKTGDLGEYKNGLLFIKGRKKNLIIRGGININPKDIEIAIKNHFPVLECVVFSSGKAGTELVCCWYESKELLCLRDVNQYLQDKLGKNMSVNLLKKIDVIPRLTNLKIDMQKIKEIAQEEV